MNKQAMQKMWLPLLICLIAFYIFPVLGKDTGAFILILLVATPFICFITSLLHSLKHGFLIILPIAVGLLFCPSIFLFYNSSAWVYPLFYSFLSLIGSLLGVWLRKVKKDTSKAIE
jgi:hypothetical protein